MKVLNFYLTFARQALKKTEFYLDFEKKADLSFELNLALF